MAPAKKKHRLLIVDVDAAVQTSASPDFRLLPIADISESALNPRKAFDEKKQAELTESVRTKGVLEPLLVRPAVPEGKYELAAGARRLRAAVAAGLAQVPALVRPMTDAELLEVALVENVQRADINALEEGAAYRQLVDRHGYAVEQLCAKTGKARTTVFARMKLASLEGEARELVLCGKLSASIGELIARLPTPAAQEKALKKLRERFRYDLDDETDLSSLSFRDAKDELEAELVLRLKSAPFDVAGACAACPNHTGAQAELYPDVRDDTCLDDGCWAGKKAEAFKRLKTTYEERGQTLLKGGEKLFDSYRPSELSYRAKEKYSTAGEQAGSTGKTWAQLLGGEAPKVVAIDKKGKAHHLVDKAAAVKLLAEKDEQLAKKATERSSYGSADWQVRADKEAAKRRAEELVESYLKRRVPPLFRDVEEAALLALVAAASDEWGYAPACAVAGVSPKTPPAKLRASERAALLVAVALSDARGKARSELLGVVAKRAKLDLPALRKKAAKAEKGTCFACGCREEKACAGGCAWVDEAETLCTACCGDD